jgi:hypothetical protein
VSRRPDPDRVRGAREEALRSRLLGDGLLPQEVDRWIATILGDGVDDPSTAAFWEHGYNWISGQIASKRRTTRS